MSEKNYSTSWLIQRFFRLQVASSRLSRWVYCFRPYSALDSFEFAKASPSKICLNYELNQYIKDWGIR